MATLAVERRLVAILAADVVGYSRLMRADEAGTLAQLKVLREELVGPIVAAHRGRIVKLMGDGVLVEFGSVVDAVECAAAIQKGVAEREAELPEEQRIAFRIGINIGDVIVEGDDLYGDAVNVAARLEGIAEPGGICISAKVFDEVRRKPGLGFADLGGQRVKNIPEPIGAYRVLLDPVAAGTVVPAELTAPSIAVLPFENLSRDYWLGYFSDGITEDIITGLARHPDLPVIARDSSFAYRGRDADDPEIARALDVRYVLDGGVRRTDRRIEINARLVDSKTGDPIWTERYNRPLDDAVAILHDVRGEILTALNVAPPEDGHAPTAANPEAYDLLLRARELRYNSQPATTAEAIRFMERAAELDPKFAAGWSELALTHHLGTASRRAESSEDAWDRAIECAERALALDPSLGEPHTVLGAVLLKRGEFSRAVRELEAGAAASPNAAWPVAMLARALPNHGRPTEGLEMIRRAFRLNPSAPGWYFEAEGWSHFALRQYDEAIAAFGEAVQRSPNDLGSHIGLTVGYQAAGREDEARTEALELLRIDPEFSCFEARREVIDRVLRERQIALLREAGLPGGRETVAAPDARGQDADAWLTNFIDTINANMPPNLDADAVANCFAEDCVHVQPLRELPGGPIRGREAQRRFYATFDAHWSTLVMNELSRVVHGRRAVWEGVMESTHKKTGKPVKLPMVFILDFDEEGKIRKELVYMDNGLVEEQIR
jgi:adenylate cyclase